MSIKQLTKEKLRALMPDKASIRKEKQSSATMRQTASKTPEQKTQQAATRQRKEFVPKDTRSEKTRSKPYYSYIGGVDHEAVSQTPKEEVEKPETQPKAMRQQNEPAPKDTRSEKTQSKPYYSYIGSVDPK
jgi:hypothetical protein